MADDNEFEGFHIVNPEDLPEELQKLLARKMEQMDRHHMAHESKVRRIENLLDSLNDDDLFTLHLLIEGFAQSKRLAVYYDGMISQMLRSKGICLDHGVNHEAEAMEEMAREIKGDNGAAVARKIAEDDAAQATTDEGAYLTKCKIFNVRPLDADAFDPEDPTVQCIKCGHIFPSLDDRMRRSPNNCDGCIQKAKWG